MKKSIEQELLVEIVSRFRQRICIGAGEKINRALFVREGGQSVLPKWGGFAAGAAAYLALQPHPDNPFYGRDDLLQFAFAAGDRLLLDHAELGLKHLKPNHFTIFPLTPLYDLAAEQAGAKRRDQWRELMTRNLKRVDELVVRCGATLGKPGPWAGTGPNHIFGWLAIGYGQAKSLHDDVRMRRYEKALLKHLKIQTPGGYFPEHIGPVVEYHAVSMDGVAEFYFHRANPVVREALERGTHYFVRALYPDLRGIDTLDERNRLAHGATLRGCLVWTGEGRALLRRVLERTRAAAATATLPKSPKHHGARFIGGVDWWGMGALYRAFEQAGVAVERASARGQASETPLPLERPRFSYQIEKKALIRKEGPWFYALSAYSHPTLPGNPYHLERTQAFSLYHEKIGLIVGGGHDKRAPHNSTVHVVEEREVHYYPAIKIDLSVAKPAKLLTGGAAGKATRVDGLSFQFGCAQAHLEVAVVSPRMIKLCLSAQSNMVNAEIALVLQLALKAPATLRTGSLKQGMHSMRLQPMRAGEAMEDIPLGAVIERPDLWRMRLTPGSRLNWPHRAWNPYMPPEYRDPAENAVALVRIPIRKRTGRAEVTIEVLG